MCFWWGRQWHENGHNWGHACMYGFWWILIDFRICWLNLIVFDGFWWILMDFDGILFVWGGAWPWRGERAGEWAGGDHRCDGQGCLRHPREISNPQKWLLQGLRQHQRSECPVHNVFINPSMHASIHPSIHPWHPYIHTSITSIHPAIHPSIHTSITSIRQLHPCIRPFIHP